jgi:serine/threonine protein kinase
VGVVLPQPIQFGKYTLFERIGRGGMADVFKARIQGPAGFERVFVVKRILPHLSDDQQFTKMFIEEAKLSARLTHPNIVQVFELGSVEAEYFIAMEYVRGRDLAETMRTHWARVGPPRPELVAYIGREMCRALGYAHELTGEDGSAVGMIHRDISPSNVMLSYEGAVKILDFGIAKALGGDKQEESATQRGTLKGKFAYMAPEQTQGSDVDRRIDVFATGIVLHEMLTGRRLFKGENDLQTVEKVRQCEVPPPSLQNPLCPPELDAIVLKALAKNREERFQSAHEMADALDDVVHAARFQPTHLAGLMRDLFPSDAGGAAGASSRITQSLSTSGSRPHSSAMRSPTVSPVSVSRSTLSGIKAGSMSEVSARYAGVLPPKPFWKRGGALAIGVGLVGVAFVGGVMVTRSQVQPSPSGAAPAAAKPVKKQSEIVLRSWPDGAEVFRVGAAQPRAIGTTPLRVAFEFTGDEKIRLLFRKPGYEDVEKEVAYYHPSVDAHLKPGSSGRLGRPRPRVEMLGARPPAPVAASGAAEAPPPPATVEAPPPAAAPAPAASGARAPTTASGRSSRTTPRDRSGAAPAGASPAGKPASDPSLADPFTGASGKPADGKGGKKFDSKSVVDPFAN